jgi:hypothetical protein
VVFLQFVTKSKSVYVPGIELKVTFAAAEPVTVWLSIKA